MNDSSSTSFLGHPRGLATLFFTEMWERFSYYGMRAILILYMTKSVAEGGMGIDDDEGAAIYGLYTMFVYLLALPGGWLADKLYGLQKAVWIGGIIIALGHFSMAIPMDETFFIGLVLIVLGTGLLKPNISSIVGGLYPIEESARRDAGFSIFYTGINVGAFVAPLIVGYLAEEIGWHWGFGAAGAGMFFGVLQYRFTQNYLGDVGAAPEPTGTPEQDAANRKKISTGVVVFLVALVILIGLVISGVISINPIAIAEYSAVTILGVVTLYFLYVFIFIPLSLDEKKKIGVIAILFFFSAIFWSGFEQAGSSLNLFADRYTDKMIFGWEMPTSWLQSVNPMFIILLAPAFGALWINLAKRNLQPYTPVKFALGLLFLGLGFGVMALASVFVISQGDVLPTWLILTYLFHTTGELCLSPVGLSAVTKLSPKKLVGQMMGIWFMSIALGNLIAGLVAGEINEEEIAANPDQLPELFTNIAIFTIVGGLLLMILYKPIKKMMGNVH
jgi:POT family proton-dependent oligopeptide transporter